MTQVLDARWLIDVLLDARASLEDIEAVVEQLQLPVDEADAVWLYAWAERERRARRHGTPTALKRTALELTNS